MANYPSALWAGLTVPTNQSTGPAHRSVHQTTIDELVAVQAELGPNAGRRMVRYYASTAARDADSANWDDGTLCFVTADNTYYARIDAAWLALATAGSLTYTPTTGNITGGTPIYGSYFPRGKWVDLVLAIGGGTATAALPVTLSLPPGMTAKTTHSQPLYAYKTGGLLVAAVSGSTTVSIWADHLQANWGVGASVSTVRVSGSIELA